MRLSNSGNKTNFTDGFFHFIFSQQVLEHVRDLESLATEAFRVTAPGGIGFHVYPAHKRVGEGHLYMPFVHWLPKNRLRELTIRFFLMLGKNPGWKEMRGKSIAEQAGAYYEYSLNHTFYRHWRDVANTFEKTGFTAKFITLGHIRIENSRVLSRLLKIRPVRAAAYRLHLYFFPFLELLVRKE
jgi:SAM-dependent methyltransferase